MCTQNPSPLNLNFWRKKSLDLNLKNQTYCQGMASKRKVEFPGEDERTAVPHGKVERCVQTHTAQYSMCSDERFDEVFASNENGGEEAKCPYPTIPDCFTITSAVSERVVLSDLDHDLPSHPLRKLHSVIRSLMGQSHIPGPYDAQGLAIDIRLRCVRECDVTSTNTESFLPLRTGVHRFVTMTIEFFSMKGPTRNRYASAVAAPIYTRLLNVHIYPIPAFTDVLRIISLETFEKTNVRELDIECLIPNRNREKYAWMQAGQYAYDLFRMVNIDPTLSKLFSKLKFLRVVGPAFRSCGKNVVQSNGLWLIGEF